MVIKTRARTDSAKNARRNHLLAVARELFQTNGMGFSMQDVARTANLAKGTTYLYFATKEELLLSLLIEELSDWFTEFANILEQAQPTAKAIAKSISSRPTLVALLALQANILEHNLSAEAALGFKQFLAQASGEASSRLEKWLPNTNGLEVLQILNALVIGLAQLANPSKTMLDILEQNELKHMQVDFEKTLEHGLEALLKGFL